MRVLLVAATLLSACGVPTASASAPADPAAAVGRSPLAVVPPSPEPTATPTHAAASNPGSPVEPPPPSLDVDAIGEVIVTDLVVRSAPGTGADSTILEDRLTLGDRFIVVAGPVEASGYEWVQVHRIVPEQPPATLGYLCCGDPPVFGWIATGSREGEAWVVPDDVDCAIGGDPVATLTVLTPEERLYCFSDDTLAFTASAQPTGCGAVGGFEGPIVEPMWLSGVKPVALSDRLAIDGEYDLLIVPSASDQQSGMFCGAPGGQYDIAGGFDHPEAESCVYMWHDNPDVPGGPPSPPDPAQVILHCRTMFVAESLEPIP